MYIREKVCKRVKIINVILVVLGVFLIVSSLTVMTSLISFYWGDWYTISHAKATPEVIINIFVGSTMLIIACILKYQMGNVVFYSRYFEGDLDGLIKYSDLAELMEKSERRIKKQMSFYRKCFMKGFALREEEGIEQIVLDSKTCVCECKSCGAIIEKKMYFTGTCPYCKSSDVFARVLTNQQFYSISYAKSPKKNRASFYLSKQTERNYVIFISLLVVAITVMIIAGIAISDYENKLYDKEYQTKMILQDITHNPSYRIVKAKMIDGIIFSFGLVVAMIPLINSMFYRIKTIVVAQSCSKSLARRKKPFVLPKDLPPVKKKNGRLKDVIRAVRWGYLKNCSFEMHDGILKMALAKKIVKDQCPTCGASIVGAADENYKCQYCGNMIMHVVQKK